jgi:hypothetical protein
MANARESAVLTVAAIRSGAKRTTQYLFNERQSIFTSAERVAADDASVRLLKAALESKRPIKAVIDTRRGLIRRVAEPSRRELEEFQRTRIPLEKPAKVVPVEVAKIDPTVFNFVDLHQRWPSFRLCTRIIPSYTKAKEIFDFCAQLSCNLPGPYAVPPCIPFQYVRDGCYARAHQMRRIITTRYRYCCEKVFSFANQGSDQLAVKANKWGGCCVTWWYHVAPLVRVRLRIRRHPRISLTLAMVIDPGMFDKPVLLSTWLAAQQDTTCIPNAHVSMYSIQPGSAYWPTNYAGTTFGTDPNYTLTQGTLLAYAGLTTCP